VNQRTILREPVAAVVDATVESNYPVPQIWTIFDLRRKMGLNPHSSCVVEQ